MAQPEIISVAAATASVEEVGEYHSKLINRKVELKHGRRTHSVWAHETEHTIFFYGFTGRYRTGTKVWGATLEFYKKDNRWYANFGRDDRDWKFQKMDGLHFTPELFFK